jgi:hypothetical protein
VQDAAFLREHWYRVQLLFRARRFADRTACGDIQFHPSQRAYSSPNRFERIYASTGFLRKFDLSVSSGVITMTLAPSSKGAPSITTFLPMTFPMATRMSAMLPSATAQVELSESRQVERQGACGHTISIWLIAKRLLLEEIRSI